MSTVQTLLFFFFTIFVEIGLTYKWVGIFWGHFDHIGVYLQNDNYNDDNQHNYHAQIFPSILF